MSSEFILVLGTASILEKLKSNWSLFFVAGIKALKNAISRKPKNTGDIIESLLKRGELWQKLEIIKSIF